MKKIIFSAAMLTVALATAQNTGIGTTKPKAQLDVGNTIRIDREKGGILGIGIREYETPWARGYNFTDADATKSYGGFYAYGDGSNAMAGVKFFGIGSVNQLDATSLNFESIARFYPADKLTWLNGRLRISSLPDAANTDSVLLADAEGNITKSNAATLLGANSEWYYDSTLNQIRLRRSDQASGFTNNVYYKNNTGSYYNYDDAQFDSFDNVTNTERTDVFKEEGVRFAIEANSKNITAIVNETNTGSSKTTANTTLYVDETTPQIGSFLASGSGSSVITSKNNQAPTYWLQGNGGYVRKMDLQPTNYISGSSNSVSILRGSVTGYAVGTRTEIYANTPENINAISGINNFTTTGPNAGNINSMTVFAGGLNYTTTGSPVIQRATQFEGALNIAQENNVSIQDAIGLYYGGIYTPKTSVNVVNNYGIYLADLKKAQNNWSIFTNAGKVSFGDVLQLRTINDTANASSNASDKILVADAEGNVKTGASLASVSSASEPWKVAGTTNAATSNDQVIYQSNDVLVGSGNVSDIGTLTLGANEGSPISNRIVYGTDDTGYKLAFSKSNAGTTTDQMVIEDNGNVGIGTTSPNAKLDINNGFIRTVNENSWSGMTNYTYSDTPSHYGFNFSLRGRGTQAAPQYPNSGDYLGAVMARDVIDGFNATNYGGAGVEFISAEDMSATNKGSYISFITTAKGQSTPFRRAIITDSGDMGIGTDYPTQKLEVAGNVRANSFIASTTTYPDYVFQNYFTGTASNLNPSYKFTTLAETEKFIKENGHLPGFKKAEDVVKEGSFNVSETSLKSLEKIEELYLHMIELEKRVKDLEVENAKLKAAK